MLGADLALARLLRLASPVLPVGAFSYSQGLEPAVERGICRDESSAREWIGGVLDSSIGRFEAPIWWRLYEGWAGPRIESVEAWNELFLAARETAELRAETRQMGHSMRALLLACGEFADERVSALSEIEAPAFPTAFTFACACWHIPARQALLAYVWSWLENQVTAAMKAIPLGQTAGQRLLAELSARLPDLVETAVAMTDEELSNFAPGLAIASCWHETQYSRLFRS